MKRYLIIGVALAMLLVACGGDSGTTTTAGGTETTSGGTDTTEGATDTTAGVTDTTAAAAGGMEELIAAAQEEGTLTTIALPHDWCGYGAVIEGFKTAYGLEVNELDPGAGSAEELEAIDANRDNPGPQAPDVVDVGLAFGPQAKEAGLIQPYMVSTWDEIPEDAKDAEGYWYGDYYGVLSLEVNTSSVSEPPAEYADLLDPAYNGQVALSGDPLTSNAAILSVWAAGLATGATGEEAAQAGLDFFAELNAAGNFVPIDGDSRTVGIGEMLDGGWQMVQVQAPRSKSRASTGSVPAVRV